MASTHSLAAAATLILGAVLGCGGAQTQPDSMESLLATPTAAPSSAPAAAAAPAPAPKGGDGDLTDEQEQQMEIALRRGGEKAANCATVVQGAPGGSGEVHVLFDGQKGRVTDVTVGPPWAGTPVEACIKRSFIGEIVVPFKGDPRDVPYTIKIGKAPADDDATKDKDAKDNDGKGKDGKGKGKAPDAKKDKKK
jgi:hypothetical protein